MKSTTSKHLNLIWENFLRLQTPKGCIYNVLIFNPTFGSIQLPKIWFELTPDNYGYALKGCDSLIPVKTEEERLPEDFPAPCLCVKCARKNVCPCRVLDILCCKFCK